MVDGTLALSMPGLFLTGVTYFKLVRCAGDFKDDFALCWLKFESVELRFNRWGLAAKVPKPLTQANAEEWERNLASKYSPEQVKWAKSVLQRIVKTFDRIRDRVNDDTNEIRLISKGPAEEPKLVDEDEELGRNPKLAAANRFFKKAGKKYHSFIDAAKFLNDRTKWALHKKDYLVQLVNEIADVVSALETQFPDIAEEAQKLARAEASDVASLGESAGSVDSDMLRTLLYVAGTTDPENRQPTDPALEQAIKEEVQSRGFTLEYTNNEIKDFAVVHLGDSYDKVPEQGVTSTRYDKNIMGGNSRTQAGNSYDVGGSKVFGGGNKSAAPNSD